MEIPESIDELRALLAEAEERYRLRPFSPWSHEDIRQINILNKKLVELYCLKDKTAEHSSES